jgi:hypothetical protein
VHIAALVLSIVLALVMLGSGVAKLIHAPGVVIQMEAVKVTRQQMTALGVIEAAATLGLIVGIWFPPLAVAAATGVVIYFVGAIVAHLRASDRGFQGAVAFLVLAVATLTLLLVAA